MTFRELALLPPSGDRFVTRRDGWDRTEDLLNTRPSRPTLDHWGGTDIIAVFLCLCYAFSYFLSRRGSHMGLTCRLGWRPVLFWRIQWTRPFFVYGFCLMPLYYTVLTPGKISESKIARTAILDMDISPVFMLRLCSVVILVLGGLPVT
jgi:hypothetical protein